MPECLMAGLDRWNSRDAPELPASIRLWPEVREVQPQSLAGQIERLPHEGRVRLTDESKGCALCNNYTDSPLCRASRKPAVLPR